MSNRRRIVVGYFIYSSFRVIFIYFPFANFVRYYGLERVNEIDQFTKMRSFMSEVLCNIYNYVDNIRRTAAPKVVVPLISREREGTSCHGIVYQ